MGRRLRAAAGALWLALPVAAGAMWVRSCRTMDELSAVDGGNVLRAAVSYRGAVHWMRAEKNSTPRGWAWDAYDVPAGATWAELYALDDLDWRHAGFAKLSAPKPAAAVAAAPAPRRVVIPPPASAPVLRRPPGAAPSRMVRAPPATAPARTVPATPGAAPAAAAPPVALLPAMPLAVKVRPKIAPWLFTVPYVAYAVPYWPVLAVTSVPALRVTARLVSRWRRKRRGLCPGCGYDLRGSGGRCPECGEEIAATPLGPGAAVTTSKDAPATPPTTPPGG